MILKHLSIINYRNIPSCELDFSPKINCFLGMNGEGKTNLLDAIHFLSLCRSYATSQDSLCILHNQDIMSIAGQYETEDGTPEDIHIGIRRGQKKVVRRGKKAYPATPAVRWARTSSTAAGWSLSTVRPAVPRKRTAATLRTATASSCRNNSCPPLRKENHELKRIPGKIFPGILFCFLPTGNKRAQNRKSRRLEDRISRICSSAICLTFSFGIFFSSSSIIR